VRCWPGRSFFKIPIDEWGDQIYNGPSFFDRWAEPTLGPSH
jgi:hypothetical protein